MKICVLALFILVPLVLGDAVPKASKIHHQIHDPHGKSTSFSYNNIFSHQLHPIKNGIHPTQKLPVHVGHTENFLKSKHHRYGSTVPVFHSLPNHQRHQPHAGFIASYPIGYYHPHRPVFPAYTGIQPHAFNQVGLKSAHENGYQYPFGLHHNNYY